MRTLTVEEAGAGLAQWLELALSGEQVQIRRGDAVVELRPLPMAPPALPQAQLTPREALRRLQADAQLARAQAESYLREAREERLATEGRRSA